MLPGVMIGGLELVTVDWVVSGLVELKEVEVRVRVEATPGVGGVNWNDGALEDVSLSNSALEVC